MDDNELFGRVVRRIHEAVGASEAYSKKESVRKALQDLIVTEISSGNISSQEEFDDWFKTATMSLSALKMVPFGAFEALSRKK